MTMLLYYFIHICDQCTLLKTIFLFSDVIEDVTWLRSSCHPWNLVTEKWQKTFEYRRTELNSSDKTIENYMNTYIALKKPAGYNLLLSDFASQYPESVNKLIENFPLYKNKILELTLQKYRRHPESNIREFIEEYANLCKA